jgi:hypothetical protein
MWELRRYSFANFQYQSQVPEKSWFASPSAEFAGRIFTSSKASWPTRRFRSFPATKLSGW